MNRNQLLYNASMALVECAKYINPVDRDFTQIMLDKAQEFSEKITVDSELEKEVDDIEREIRKGL
jgi:hypothetical protein